MARNPKKELKISYKVSNGTLQLKISFGYVVQPEPYLASYEQDEKGRIFNQKYERVVYPVIYAPFYIATGIKGITTDNWDSKNHKLVGDLGFRQHQLDLLLQRIHDAYQLLRVTMSQDQITPEYFKKAIKKHVKDFEKKIPTIDVESDLASDGKLYVLNNQIVKGRFAYMPLTDFLDFKIKQWRKGEKTPGTINGYIGLRKWLRKFNDEVGLVRIKDFSDLFLKRFFDFVKESGEFKMNYLNKLFRQLRMLNNVIENEEKFDLNIHWKADYLPRSTEVSYEVALEYQQLLTVYNVKTPETKPSYEKIKDLFVFGCLTGLRISDLQDVNIEESRGQFWVRQTMQKVRDQVKVPLHPLAKEIFEKYKGSLPVLNRQKFSNVIKELCELAGLTHSVTRYRTNPKTKELIKESVRFSDCVKSSSCRRTFATLCVYEWNIPPTIAKKYTGHRKLTTFLTYIRANDETVEDLLAEKFNELHDKSKG